MNTTTLKQVLRRIMSALSLLVCTACNSSPPTVPIEKPFGLGKGGESVEFDFRVKKTYGHSLWLLIHFHHQEIGKEREKEKEKFFPQLGDRVLPDGSVPNPGVPITLRVRVKSIDVQGPPVDFDVTTDKIGFLGASLKVAEKEVIDQIANQKLQPGTYHISVDNLHPVPEFADRTVQIALHHTYQGK